MKQLPRSTYRSADESDVDEPESEGLIAELADAGRAARAYAAALAKAAAEAQSLAASAMRQESFRQNVNALPSAWRRTFTLALVTAVLAIGAGLLGVHSGPVSAAACCVATLAHTSLGMAASVAQVQWRQNPGFRNAVLLAGAATAALLCSVVLLSLQWAWQLPLSAMIVQLLAAVSAFAISGLPSAGFQRHRTTRRDYQLAVRARERQQAIFDGSLAGLDAAHANLRRWLLTSSGNVRHGAAQRSKK